MTAHDYIDEVKLRLPRYNISINFGDAIILTAINRARRSVQKSSLGLYPERYARIIGLPINLGDVYNVYAQPNAYSNLSLNIIWKQIPDDIINIETVLLRYQANDGAPTYRSEARPVTKWELFSANMNAFSVPTKEMPIYAVERDLNTNTYFIYFAGIEDNGGLIFDSNTALLEIWYVASLLDIEDVNSIGNDDTDSVIPGFLQELVIYYAIQYLLQTTDITESLNSIIDEIKRMEDLVKSRYEVNTDIKEYLLPSKQGI